jgi:hypothetical protein
MPRYCDDCQLPLDQCPENCPGRMEREEYARAMSEWEQSVEWMETPPY